MFMRYSPYRGPIESYSPYKGSIRAYTSYLRTILRLDRLTDPKGIQLRKPRKKKEVMALLALDLVVLKVHDLPRGYTTDEEFGNKASLPCLRVHFTERRYR